MRFIVIFLRVLLCDEKRKTSQKAEISSDVIASAFVIPLPALFNSLMTFDSVVFCSQKLQKIADPQQEGQRSSYTKLKVDVSQHFAHLHGVLQNVENNMLCIIDGQMKHFSKNRDALLNEIKRNEDKISNLLKVK